MNRPSEAQLDAARRATDEAILRAWREEDSLVPTAALTEAISLALIYVGDCIRAGGDR